jgi:hypothetical protein
MLAIAGQTIDTSTYKKIRVGFGCLAKQFIDIALVVGDMNTSFRAAVASQMTTTTSS